VSIDLLHPSLADVVSLIAPIFPVLFALEMVFLVYIYRGSFNVLSRAVKLPLLIYVAHWAVGTFLYIDVFLSTQRFFSQLALFHVPVTVAGFLYAYVIWELGHFISHWSCHKVRLLWCIHAPHHAPNHMNLAVTNANFMYQETYATFVRTAICSALGVPMPLLLLAIVVDTCWGSLIHVSEEAWRKGRLPGLLGRVILSPIHHRVHHACNPEYIDKNYCNTLPLWDKVFGTYQDEIEGVPPRYGITRTLKPGSFVDLYFGEIVLLLKDVAGARSFTNAVLYVVMPPGWKPKACEAERLSPRSR
jgi:sterol desaturase/sphingolipid hydroxylase (fatty acid hydroxylase superfamily)